MIKAVFFFLFFFGGGRGGILIFFPFNFKSVCISSTKIYGLRCYHCLVQDFSFNLVYTVYTRVSCDFLRPNFYPKF